MTLPIYTHIPNLKVLTKIFFKLSRPKGNLCGGDGGGVTVLNPKYPRLSSGDTMNEILRFMQKRDERTDGQMQGRKEFYISPSAAGGRQ